MRPLLALPARGPSSSRREQATLPGAARAPAGTRRPRRQGPAAAPEPFPQSPCRRLPRLLERLSLMPPTRLGLGAVFVIPGLGGQKILGLPFRGTLVPGLGEATAPFRLPSPGFPGLDPRSPLARFLLLPTTLFSWMSRAERALPAAPPSPPPPPPALLPGEAGYQKQNNWEEGWEGKKSYACLVCPLWY